MSDARSRLPGGGRVGWGARSLCVVIAILVGAVLWLAGRVFLLAFLGVVFGVFLHSAADFVHRKSRLGYRISLLGVVCLLAVIAGLAMWKVQSQLAQQADQVMTTFPTAVEKLESTLQQYEWGRRILNRAQGSPVFGAPQAISGVTSVASVVGTFFVDALVMFFVGLYCAAEPQMYRNGLLRLVSAPYRPRADRMLNAAASDLRWWLFGTFCSMVIVGVLTFTGLRLLGVPGALFLALVAASLELVPTLGPILASVPAILVALAQDPRQALWVALLYFGVQTVESYIVWPLIQRSAVRLPPALLIFSIVLMGTLAGGLGALAATPLLVVILVAVRFLYLDEPIPPQQWEASLPATADQPILSHPG